MIISCVVRGKRFISRLALVAAVVGLAACGGGGGGGSKSSSSVSTSSSSVSSSSSSVAPDVTPKDFTLSVPEATYAPEATATTNTVTITEIDALADISVSTGATYSVDGGTYTEVDGKIANNQTLTVKKSASATFGETLTVSVTVGTLTKTFDVVTEDEDTAPDAFSFTDITDAELDTVSTSAAVSITGINSPATVTVSEGGSFCIGDCSGNDAVFTTTGSIENGQLISVRGNSADTNSEKVDYTLTIGGVPGVWSVTTVADSTPPTAEIIFPTKVSLTDGTTLIVRGTAADASGIESVSVSVLNDDDVVGNAIAAEPLKGNALTEWKATVMLTPGVENTVRVSVTDEANNTDAAAAEVVVTQKSDYYATNFPEGSEMEMYSDMGDIALDYERKRILYSRYDSIISIDMETGLRSVFIDDTKSDYTTAIRSLEIVDNTLYFPVEEDDVILKTDLDSVNVTVVSDMNNAGSDVNISAPFWLAYSQSLGAMYAVDFLEGIYTVDLLNGNRTLISGDSRPVNGDNPMETPTHMVLLSDSESAVVLDVTDSKLTNALLVDLDSGVRGEPTEVLQGDFIGQSSGIEYDGGVQVFFSDAYRTKLMRYNIDSKGVSVLSDGELSPNQFFSPAGLAFDDHNLLYFIANDTAGLFHDSCGSLMLLDLDTQERVVLSKDACQ